MKLCVWSLLCLFLSRSAFAATVTLAWDAVPALDLAGYVLYYGYASGSYSMSVDVGNTTTAVLSGLDEGKRFYFAATAYDVYGHQSSFSNEVSYAVPVADATAPTITITSPADGTPVQRKSTVTISGTAWDDVGVTKVKFYVNGSLICTDVTAPYACTWKVPAPSGRTYRLQADVYDGQGNVGSASIVTVHSR